MSKGMNRMATCLWCAVLLAIGICIIFIILTRGKLP